MNAVEAAALKRAKEERRKLAEIRRSPHKKQDDILMGPNRDSVYRVMYCAEVAYLRPQSIAVGTARYLGTFKII